MTKKTYVPADLIIIETDDNKRIADKKGKTIAFISKQISGIDQLIKELVCDVYYRGYINGSKDATENIKKQIRDFIYISNSE